MARASSPDLDLLLAQAGWLRKLALHLVRDPDEADDLVQDAWQRALERPIDPGALEPGVRAWLGRVLRNLASNRRRDARTRTWHEGAAIAPEAASSEAWSPAEVQDRVELQRRLAEAVLGLEEPYRSAVTLRYFEELSPQEIARRQRIGYDAARQQLSRGIAMLRARLDRDHEGDRAAWCAAVLSLLGPAKAPHSLSPLLAGAILMGINLKLLGGAAATVLLLAFVAWRVVGIDAPARPSDSLAASGSGPLTAGLPEGREDPPGTHELSREAMSSSGTGTVQPAIDRDRDLHGEVVDPEGSPVAGAAIEVSSWATSGFSVLEFDRPSDRRTVARTSTDAEGKFAVPLPMARPFDLDVRAAGFASERLRDRYAGEHVSVRLHTGSVLVGRISRASDGAPVEGATVRSGSGRFQIFEGGATDAEGKFRFENLAPGTIEVEILPPIGLTPVRRAVELRAGETHELLVSLEAGATLRGRVIDAASRAPIANAEVGEGWWIQRSVRTGTDGEYVLAGFPVEGVYELIVRAQGYGRGERTPFLLPTDAVPERIDFELQPARTARGRIVDEQGLPLEKAYVAAAASSTDPGQQRTDWISSTTGPDGTFRLLDVRPDIPHALIARKEGFGTVTYDFPESENPSIDLGDVVLPAMSTLRGNVVDEAGHGIPDLEVTLYGANADRSRFLERERPAGSLDSYVSLRSGRTDDLGRFGFADLAAGNYRIETQMKGAGFRQSIEQAVVVAKGEDVAGVRLVLHGGVSIEGRVVDGKGRPVPRALLSIVAANGGGEPGIIIADGDGRFVAAGLSPGVFEIQARTLDWGDQAGSATRLAPTSVSGIQGGRGDVEIVMRPARVLRGSVVDADGKPVARAFVSASAKGGQESGSGMTDTAGRFALDVAEGDVLELEVRPPLPSKHPNVPVVPDQDPAHLARLSGVVPGEEEIVIRLPGTR